jgi:hypothetical protein
MVNNTQMYFCDLLTISDIEKLERWNGLRQRQHGRRSHVSEIKTSIFNSITNDWDLPTCVDNIHMCTTYICGQHTHVDYIPIHPYLCKLHAHI